MASGQRAQTWMICAVGAGSCKHGRNVAAGLKSLVKSGGSLGPVFIERDPAPGCYGARARAGWSESGNGDAADVVRGGRARVRRLPHHGPWPAGRGPGQQALCAITGKRLSEPQLNRHGALPTRSMLYRAAGLALSRSNRAGKIAA
jgi:hypothetical protein